MKNKINGIDVSGYFIDVVDEGGSTIDYKILPNSERLLVEKIFEQNQQLKRLQEKNEEQKEQIKQLEDFVKSDGEIDNINHEYTYKLQKENEELKKKNKELLNLSNTGGALLVTESAKTKKYKQALEQIRKEYTNSIFYQCDKTEEECPCHNCIILGQLDRVQNIVKIIDEALNDRD